MRRGTKSKRTKSKRSKSKRTRSKRKRGGKYDPNIDKDIETDRQNKKIDLKEYDNQRELERRRRVFERPREQTTPNNGVDDTSALFESYGISGVNVRD